MAGATRLILTHENSDFDAVAAQLAARRLYPDAQPLLARRVNRNVTHFLELYGESMPFVSMADWRRRKVDEVILVDTQALPSVRGVRPDTPVRLIDHHPGDEAPTDWHRLVEPVGATTTILVEMIQRCGLALKVDEATLLLLGIYEDTGTLSYDTTTARDIRAAAWLLEQGAQLSIARRFLNIALSPEQQALYDQLLASVTWHELHERHVAVATAEAPPDFGEEVSTLAHRLRDALSPDGLCILIQLPRHIQLVARSSNDAVDVGVLARAFGGGGHGRAAAATILDQTLDTARAQLLDCLPQAIRPVVTVDQIMSRGVQTIDASASIMEAEALMQRYGYEGYPVVDPEQGHSLVGLLTRRAVDRALSHELGELAVRQVMKAGQVSVTPEDSLVTVRRLMMEEGWGQIPVLRHHDGAPELIGIVTRTDVLNVMAGERATPDREVLPPTDLRRQLSEFLPPAVWAMVKVIGATAGDLGMRLYFVGGLVRDLLLDLTASDIDFTVEGDAIRLARTLRRRFGGELRQHRRFNTAKWLLTPAVWERMAPTVQPPEDVRAIDFATTRIEFYTRPTALPEVENSSIRHDLHRRDFTINTLAVRLDGAHLGELLDFYNGQRDLKQGVIRVLHSLSFIDDPTRILRAVRFEQRFGFTIEPRTLELIGDSLAMLDQTTGERIKHELELTLREKNRVGSLRRLAELGVLEHITGGLSWNGVAEESFSRLGELIHDPDWRAALVGEPPISVYFALWLNALPAGVRRATMERLHVRKTTREEVAGVAHLREALAALPANPRPSQTYQAIAPAGRLPRILLAGRSACAGTIAADYLDRYWREWRHVRTSLDGHDLRAMGLPPGPRYKMLLDRLLLARLDGDVTNEAEERALVAQLVATAADSA